LRSPHLADSVLSIWKHFIIWLVALASYQLLWGAAFNQLFATYASAGSIYPLMAYFKLLSELLICGLATPWLLLVYPSGIVSRALCGGCAFVACGLTLYGLFQIVFA
jgi:hypothetical protein